MFPPNQSDDYLYQIFDAHHQDFVPQILTTPEEPSILGDTNLTQKTRKGKSLAPSNNNNDDGEDAKKIKRKEMERQRRQQMAKLKENIRSLLPPESIKGKRAASDYMNETVNYITYMKKRVGELSCERDKLKKVYNLSGLDHQGRISGGSSCVAIHAFRGGVEIVISSGFGDESQHLSAIMKVVSEEGLDVVRCVSSQTIEGFLHTIQSEVVDPAQIDLSRLQTKLNDMVSLKCIQRFHDWEN